MSTTPIATIPAWAGPLPPASVLATLPNSNPAFDKAYYAHQPPAVQALQNLSGAARVTEAQQLAAEYTIDVPVMAWNMDPWGTMILRANYGYTWVPSANNPPVLVPPGLSFPGLPVYDPNNPPAGAITVDLNIADYPPYAAPPVPSTGYNVEIGPVNANGTYQVLGADNVPDGATITGPDGLYQKHIVVVGQTPFGTSYSNYYVKVG